MTSKKGSQKVAGASTNAALVMASGATAGGRFELRKARRAFEAMRGELEAIELYVRDDVKLLIERDIKRYRASDVGEALRLAAIIAASLGLAEEGEVERLTDLARRTATVLVREYEEHARCGRFFFGKSEDVTATYPSIFAAVRAPQRKRQGGGPSGEGESVDGPGPG